MRWFQALLRRMFAKQSETPSARQSSMSSRPVAEPLVNPAPTPTVPWPEGSAVGSTTPVREDTGAVSESAAAPESDSSTSVQPTGSADASNESNRNTLSGALGGRPSSAPAGVGPVVTEVSLADLSHMEYDAVPDEYAAPPVVDQRQRSDSSTPSWSSAAVRSSVLPGQLSEEILDEFEDIAERLRDSAADEPTVIELPKRAAHPGEYRTHDVPPEFRVHRPDGTTAPRTLGAVLGDQVTDGERAADPLDRLELVRLVGTILKRLHDEELFTAGISLDAFACTLDPRPAVMLLRPDALRRVGGEFLTDPGAGSARPPFDADRNGFAILAHQLLVEGRADSDVQLPAHAHVPGLSEHQDRRLWSLWERAAGRPGSRPTISEWMEALGA